MRKSSAFSEKFQAMNVMLFIITCTDYGVNVYFVLGLITTFQCPKRCHDYDL